MSEIICGDCLGVMKLMPDGCVDSIVCDPPYGISFMGNFSFRRAGKMRRIRLY